MNQQEQWPIGASAARGGGASEVPHQAGAAGDEIAAEARHAGQTVREQAAEVARTAKDELARQAAGRKDEVAEGISSLADHVRASAGNLRRDEAWLADLLDEGGRQLGSLAETLKRRDFGSLIGALERFARREPAVFAGASVALGFATARLARSTAERRSGDKSGLDADELERELEEQGHYSAAQAPSWRQEEEQPSVDYRNWALGSERRRSGDLPVTDPASGVLP
jgi:hypothetical protein